MVSLFVGSLPMLGTTSAYAEFLSTSVITPVAFDGLATSAMTGLWAATVVGLLMTWRLAGRATLGVYAALALLNTAYILWLLPQVTVNGSATTTLTGLLVASVTMLMSVVVVGGLARWGDKVLPGAGPLVVLATWTLAAVPATLYQFFQLLRLGEFTLLSAPIQLGLLYAPLLLVLAGFGVRRWSSEARIGGLGWSWGRVVALGLTLSLLARPLEALGWYWIRYLPKDIFHDMGAPQIAAPVLDFILPSASQIEAGLAIGLVLAAQRATPTQSAWTRIGLVITSIYALGLVLVIVQFILGLVGIHITPQLG